MGELAQHLSVLHPVNEMDMYMHTCSGKLAQRLSVFPPVDIRAPGVSGELAQCLPVLHPADNRPRQCTCTHTRASLLSAYQRCLLSTTDHGRVPARTPGRAGAAFAGIDSRRQQSWMYICTHARANWCSACWRCLQLTISPSCVMQAGTVPTGGASC